MLTVAGGHFNIDHRASTPFTPSENAGAITYIIYLASNERSLCRKAQESQA
jgi:hypothetical protein